MSYIDDLSSLGSLSTSNKITYNYSAIDVQYSNCQYITSNGLSYDALPQSRNSSVVPENTYGIHISNFTPNSSSNISFPESKYTYKSSDIYITPLIHKILTINCDTTGTPTNGVVGEFIIKHTPVGSSNPGNIYLCFLISNNLSALNLVNTNDVDNIINFVMTNGTDSGSIETLLQSTIPVQSNAVQYTNNDKDKVFVFTNPINVNLKSNNFFKQLPSIGVDSYIPPFLLPFPPKNAQMLTTDNIQTAESDNIYMDCQPTGASADEIKTYNVPINSEYTQNAAKIDLMTFVVQISIIFSILVTTYFMVPRMYKWFIIDNVNKFVLNYKKKNEDLDNNNTQNSQEWVTQAIASIEGDKSAIPEYGIDTHVRLATVDLLLSIFFWSFYFAIGFNGLSFNSVIMGIYFIIFYALSVSTIQFNKMSSNYLKTKIEDKVELEGFAYPTTQGTKEVTSFFMYSDIILFFTDTINFLVKDKKWFLTFLFVLCVFIFGAAVPIYLASTNNWKLDNIDLTDTQKGTLAIIIVYSLLGSSIFYGISRMVRLSRKEWNENVGSTTYVDFVKGIANSINPFAK
jgi:uncharacterized protein YheU (UPF0270 family)